MAMACARPMAKADRTLRDTKGSSIAISSGRKRITMSVRPRYSSWRRSGRDMALRVVSTPHSIIVGWSPLSSSTP